MPDLIKLLPEGSAVIAVIVVVLLFLKQQREQEKRLESITGSFNNRITEITSSFQNQIDRLATQALQDKHATQEQIQKLFDGFMLVSKETVSAVVEMKGAVEMLTKRVDRIGIDNRQSAPKKLENT